MIDLFVRIITVYIFTKMKLHTEKLFYSKDQDLSIELTHLNSNQEADEPMEQPIMLHTTTISNLKHKYHSVHFPNLKDPKHCENIDI